ncbi:hypothetical protein QFC21_005741 [Naganishia friedmannii]|uniref:Uncharacterized protein n=1 Tax=Naganishia friedmannii TaxID=89922 RepID=A0ACC2V7H9_9TREE|nr:hypothetical protein QFC21_005741 [Naganishia friedmannii]
MISVGSALCKAVIIHKSPPDACLHSYEDFMTAFIEYPDDSSDRTVKSESGSPNPAHAQLLDPGRSKSPALTIQGSAPNWSAANSRERTFSQSYLGVDEGAGQIPSGSRTFDSSNSDIGNFPAGTFDVRSMLEETASKNTLSKTDADTLSVAPSTSATDSRVSRPSADEATEWRRKHKSLLHKLAGGTLSVRPIWIQVEENKGADKAWKLHVTKAKVADDYVREVEKQWIGWSPPSSDVNDQLNDQLHDQTLEVTSRIRQVIGFLEGDYRKKAYTKSAVPDGAQRQLGTGEEVRLKSYQTRVLVKLLFGIHPGIPDRPRPVSSPVADDERQFLLNTVQIQVEKIADALVPLGLDAKEDHANDDDDKDAEGETDVDAEGETDDDDGR